MGTTYVLLGNAAPIEHLEPDRAAALGHDVELLAEAPGGKVRAPLKGVRNAVTRFEYDDEVYTLREMYTNVTDATGHWQQHSDKPPRWVSSNNEALARRLSEDYGCEVRPMPTDWEDMPGIELARHMQRHNTLKQQAEPEEDDDK